ncbi:hypothetical protein QL285_047921 [Trifolium repens]|nr:hypothetical protein QL285_047921 [Trifolium repens]
MKLRASARHKELRASARHMKLRAPARHKELRASARHMKLRAPARHKELRASARHMELRAPARHTDLRAPAQQLVSSPARNRYAAITSACSYYPGHVPDELNDFPMRCGTAHHQDKD